MAVSSVTGTGSAGVGLGASWSRERCVPAEARAMKMACCSHEGHQGAGCRVAKVRKATVGHQGHRVAKVREATIGHHGKRCKGRGLWVG